MGIDFGYIFRISTKPAWKVRMIENVGNGNKEFEETPRKAGKTYIKGKF